MTKRAEFQGIKGIGSREPIGVAATIGTRGTSGAPTHRGSWFMMAPEASQREFGAQGKNWKAYGRDPHPSFSGWNERAKAEGKEYGGPCSILRGHIVHATWREAFLYGRRALKIKGTRPDGKPWVNPPNMMPACIGDGVQARRYFGDGTEEALYFRPIPCPNEQCEFAQADEAGNRPCKPSGMLYFRLHWPSNGLPAMLAKWQTTSWNSIERLLGLFEFFLGTEEVRPWEPQENWSHGLFASLGVANRSLVSLPFVMTIGRKSDARHARAYPVVSFTVDGDPIEWIAIRDRTIAAAGGETRLLPASSVDAAEEKVHDADYAELIGAGIPAETVHPPDALSEEGTPAEPTLFAQLAPPAEPKASNQGGSVTPSSKIYEEMLAICRKANVPQGTVEAHFGSGLHKLTGASQEDLLAQVRAAIAKLRPE